VATLLFGLALTAPGVRKQQTMSERNTEATERDSGVLNFTSCISEVVSGD